LSNLQLFLAGQEPADKINLTQGYWWLTLLIQCIFVVI
jgi:hypothetical protein